MNVFGARPNLMKVAPVHRAMMASGRFRSVLVNTGQHYDSYLSTVFLEEFGLPTPDHELAVGSGSHAQQTARVMERIEPVLAEAAADIVVAYGDVNSTVAAALVASKLRLPLAHVEAGLRSHDRSMPEEINRIVTDALSDVLFTHSPEAVENLVTEGVPSANIFPVGNVMIDTLDRCIDRARASDVLTRLDIQKETFILTTLHRPSNVDDLGALLDAVKLLTGAVQFATVLLVAHPRTKLSLQRHGLLEKLELAGVRLLEPLGYLDFLQLLETASVVLTDSGGIQEETTVLGTPCVTLRDSTERPITVSHGTNRLVGRDPELALGALEDAVHRKRSPSRPDGWDGHAAERIVDVLEAGSWSPRG